MALTTDRDSTGAIVDSGDVSAFEIRVGDCFDDAGVFSDGNSEVSKLGGTGAYIAPVKLTNTPR